MTKRRKHRTSGTRLRRRPWWLLFGVLLCLLAGWFFYPALKKRQPPPESPEKVSRVLPGPSRRPVTNLPTPIIEAKPEPVVPVPQPTPAQPAATEPVQPVPAPKPAPEVAEQAPRFPRPVQTTLEAQIALARQGISSGSVDGVVGNQTRASLTAFQHEQGLRESGELDDATRELLILDRPALTRYTVTADDCARLQPLSPTWTGKSKQSRLDYETILELVAETSCASPTLIKKLNPSVNWTTVGAGTVLSVPDAAVGDPRKAGSFIRIFLHQRLLQVFDNESNLLAHFPCSIAKRVEKRPEGELLITAVAPDPDYTFDPALFPESAEARQLSGRFILPPGPNNPVGVAWISLSKAGYGIHGTPSPEQVGRTESHGCFRLANWNALHLLKIARIGMPVYVE